MQPHQLGEEFCEQVPGVGRLTAKLALYHRLDDGYGKYFHNIFNSDDKENPYFIMRVGAPQFGPYSQSLREACDAFIKEKGLEQGAWHSNWKSIAYTDEWVSAVCRREGDAGYNLMDALRPYDLNPFEEFLAKCILLNMFNVRKALKWVFTPQERESCWYREFILSDNWNPSAGFREQAVYRAVCKKAEEILKQRVIRLRRNDTLTGVTFGWQYGNEWHLLGDLSNMSVFKCDEEEMVRLFNIAAVPDMPKEMASQLYENTDLCMVTAQMKNLPLPSTTPIAYMYQVPMGSLIACKWIGRLPSVCGDYY